MSCWSDLRGVTWIICFAWMSVVLHVSQMFCRNIRCFCMERCALLVCLMSLRSVRMSNPCALQSCPAGSHVCYGHKSFDSTIRTDLLLGSACATHWPDLCCLLGHGLLQRAFRVASDYSTSAYAMLECGSGRRCSTIGVSCSRCFF